MKSIMMPCIMGVLNITPDSFSDGGRFLGIEKAIEHAFSLIEAGALILDVGAESSRPGAEKIDAKTEKSRLELILPALVHAFNDVLGKQLFISLDSYKPETMRWALDLGVHIINDISGFTDPENIKAILPYDCNICVMHMQNRPSHMQINPQYQNIVQEVHDFLCLQTLKLCEQGVAPERIILDVGFGFGKTLAHNTSLLNHLSEFKKLNYEGFYQRYQQKTLELSSMQMISFSDQTLQNLIDLQHSYLNLVGVSNKTMIGDITGRPIDQRQAGNDALHLLALQKGADILRVHDVRSAVDVLKIHQHFEKNFS